MSNGCLILKCSKSLLDFLVYMTHICFSITLQVNAMKERNIEPYNDTFAVLSIGYSRHLELDMAESFADKISESLPKYIHTYNALLAACGIMVIKCSWTVVFCKLGNWPLPQILLFNIFDFFSIVFKFSILVWYLFELDTKRLLNHNINSTILAQKRRKILWYCKEDVGFAIFSYLLLYLLPSAITYFM